MTYEEIKLSFLKGGIRSYKVFQGHKLYSHTVASESNQRLISKRVYLTKKRHYVYYERTDVNWNYWDKGKEDSSFDPNQVEENNVFDFQPHFHLQQSDKLIRHNDLVQRQKPKKGKACK